MAGKSIEEEWKARAIIKKKQQQGRAADAFQQAAASLSFLISTGSRFDLWCLIEKEKQRRGTAALGAPRIHDPGSARLEMTPMSAASSSNASSEPS